MILAHEDWLRVLPVCHARMEFASFVRAELQNNPPDLIAVELPSSLQDVVLRGVQRLPKLSAVVYETERAGTLYLLVEPCDPAIEALRTGLELGAELELIDVDVEGYADYRDPIPDSYAATRLGFEAFYRAFCEIPRPLDPLDARRESGMAYRLQRMRDRGYADIVLICGMTHAQGVVDALAQTQPTPLAPTQRHGAQLFSLDSRCLTEVLHEPPYLQAIYELRRDGVPPPEPVPRLPAERRVGPFRVLGGLAQDVGANQGRALRDLARSAGTPLDRLRAQIALFELAVEQWQVQTGERLKPWQRYIFARFSRNLARRGGHLICDLFELLTAIRGIGDENLVHEAFELATHYPWQEDVHDLPSVTLHAEELQLGSRRLRIRPRVRKEKRRAFPLDRKRRSERYPGEWLEGFDENGFCSFPPEDLVIEDYGHYLRKRGQRVLSEEIATVEPFQTSLLDGIDMRETLRHWPTEHRIYVRDMGRVPGEVGSVVVIFDDDESNTNYSYQMTWLGEHDQESDMAFYSTEPGQGIVGPGVCRCEYGGFLMSYPPRRMYDIWLDPDYAIAKTKAERLLIAALDYSESRFVVHVAAKPPRRYMHQLASRLDRKIVHIPIGQLSPDSIKRIRVFHILAGHSKREIAKEYIW